MDFENHKPKDTIPPAWKREKNRVLDLLYKEEDALSQLRETPNNESWVEFKSAIVSFWKRMRPKVNTINKKKRPKYEALDVLKKYLFSVSSVELTESNLEKWGGYALLLDELAEATGITKVSVEESDPTQAWREGLPF